MSDLVVPVLFTVFVWWFSTGLILYLDGLPRHTYRWSLTGATVVLGLALWGLAVAAGDASVLGAYCAFTCAILIWGWHEITFLMGKVTGPVRRPCPRNSDGWTRLRLAIGTILYHELLLVASALAILWICWGEPNQIGAWTFLVLWAMRLSAKLNLFLGVRNLGEAFLPDHLRYLETYFTRKPLNLFYPMALACALVAAEVLVVGMITAEPGGFAQIGHALVLALLLLAILEHLFMVLPINSLVLWAWSLRPRQADLTTPHAPAPTQEPRVRITPTPTQST